MEFYLRIHSAIRAVDPLHIIFLDGNTWASDFSHFGDAHKNWENTSYSIHDYSGYGFPASHEIYVGNEQQRERLQKTYEKKREWMDERGLCVWNGEWGPVYARKQFEGEATEKINESRYHVLKDQLDIYSKVRQPLINLKLIYSRGTHPGSSELVHMALQGYRFPRHGVRLHIDALHDSPRCIPREKASPCR